MNGEFRANSFYIYKGGDPQKHMEREEIIQVLAKINEKILEF